MTRRGRRTGLLIGYAAATAGGVLALLAVVSSGSRSVVAIAAGMALIGRDDRPLHRVRTDERGDRHLDHGQHGAAEAQH
jgi:hypothetical protein